jgi:hypothetical protein
MQEWTHKFDDYAKEGKELFYQYETKLEEQVVTYVGPKYSKMVSWLFIVILVALPGAMVACFVLDKITNALSLEKMLGVHQRLRRCLFRAAAAHHHDEYW